MTTTHPSERILAKARVDSPYGDLRNVVEALMEALTEVENTDIPSDYALAELVWLAGRAGAEATAPLAQRLNVDGYDLIQAMKDPHSDAAEELRERLNNIVEGLVEIL